MNYLYATGIVIGGIITAAGIREAIRAAIGSEKT